MSTPLLDIQKVSMHFGGLKAIQDLDFVMEQGEIRGLIGPNGAGKTTLYNVISGVYIPTKGRFFFKGQDITKLRPHATAKLGIIRTFQGTVLYKHFTVLRNVMMGCHLHSGYSFFGGVFNTPSTRRHERENEARSMEILEFLGLAKFKDELAINLPHGHQRALGIAIGLAAQPLLLMLDEPVTGMNPEESAAMMKLIQKIRDRGITILLIEHDMKVVMGICEKITVLNFGQKIAEGTPQEILNNSDVHEAYLGGEHYVA
jgi:branched-chain amino acid transport system ATP-binding protein